MKHLFTLLALIATMTAGSQTYPWNPDSDSNGFINFSDLLELLAIYGNEFVLEELPCEIDGDTLYAAAYNLGDKEYLDCVRTCRLNNAAIPDIHLFGLFADSLINSIAQDLTPNSFNCNNPNSNASVSERFWLQFNPASIYAPLWNCKWEFDCDSSVWSGIRHTENHYMPNQSWGTISGTTTNTWEEPATTTGSMNQCVCVGLVGANVVTE